MRSHCRKLKVVSALSGAHLVIPGSGSSTLALRVYSKDDLIPMPPRTIDQAHEETLPLADLDGLDTFIKSHAFGLVIFVLSPQVTEQVLRDSSSFPRRVQQLPLRVLFVNDTAQAMEALFAIAELGGPSKRQLQQSYGQRQQKQKYIPNKLDHAGEQNMAEAAAGVATTLREWGIRQDIPTGEADLLLTIFESLGSLTSSSIEDESILYGVPVSTQTKQSLLFLLEKAEMPAENIHLQPQELLGVNDPPAHSFYLQQQQQIPQSHYSTVHQQQQQQQPLPPSQYSAAAEQPLPPSHYSTANHPQQHSQYSANPPYRPQQLQPHHHHHTQYF